MAFDDDYMYYIDGFNGWVGVIERQTLKVVWQINF